MNKAVGHDNIPAYFLRIAAPNIAPYLQCFIEFAFVNGIFPESCTRAKIIPIHKKGDKTNPNNYRPISILTCFAKILERLIYDRFLAFLKKHNVIHKTQYGFQKHTSTTHAVLDIVSTAYDNISQNLFTGLIFLDLRKAFDCVPHDILLTKLKHYGIRGPSNVLIETFLDRSQYTSINGIDSEIKSVKYGVAQGSTLGPLLFLLYINDLPNSACSLPRLFADDTCLILNSNTIPCLETKMNQDLLKVCQWCMANRIGLNPTKSNYLIIPPKLRKTTPQTYLYLNDTPLSTSKSFKYLGVHLDSQLNFHVHITEIEHKISRAVGIMSKLKHFLPQTAMIKLYYALVHPHLLYGLIIWGQTFPSYLTKLSTLQNKAIKLSCGGSYRDHATPYFKELGILKLPDLCDLETAKFVHLHFLKKLPPQLSNMFVKTSKISTRLTRSTSPSNNLSLYIPRFQTARLQRSIKYKGVKVWNAIPSNIQTETPRLFKSKLKKHILGNYN